MEDIAHYIRQQPSRSFAKGQILIYQHTEPEVLYAIRSGFVKVHDIAEDGSEQMIWLAKKYDVIPLEWLFGGNTQSRFFYSAHTDVEAFAVNKNDFLAYAKQQPEVLVAIIEAITTKYTDIMEHLNATLQPKARDKLISALYFIASRFSSDAGGMKEVELPLTHQDIANMVGISRETASVELKKLKDERIIRYNKTSFHVFIHRLEELRA